MKWLLSFLALVVVFVLWRLVVGWKAVRKGWIILNYIDEQNIEKVRELLDARPYLLGAEDEDGNTPLHAAVGRGCKEIVALLLSRGANVNARRHNGATPLHLAANHGHADIVELLAAKGGELDARAAKSVTPLHLAAAQGKRETVARLLAHGAKKELKDDWGMTARDWAMDRGYADIGALLS